MLASCFSMVFCLGFWFISWHFVPKNVRKISLHVRFSVFGSVLSFFVFLFVVVSVVVVVVVVTIVVVVVVFK